MNQGKRSGHVYEVLCEVRFAGSKDFPTGVILPGLLFTQLQAEGVVTKFDQLPQAAIPAQIRSADANLRYLGTHRMVGDNAVVAVGDHVLNVSQVESYDGWEHMRALTRGVVTKAVDSAALGKIERVSIKYLNLIPLELGADHFAAINASLRIGSRVASIEPTVFRTEFPVNDLIAVVALTAQATLQQSPGLDVMRAGESRNGMVFELDIISAKEFKGVDDIMEALEKAHVVANQIYTDIVTGGENVSR